MCGIAGIVNFRSGMDPPGRDLLGRMAGAIRHRGPDEFGYYRDARAGLAHARLSIVDLVTGQQPCCNEDGSLWITFNGEIFNYVELREELSALGHVFRSRSDTEVILHAYESWGTDCFRRFNGQWAIALWSAARRQLVLARDRVGVRPLYLRETPARCWFASEVKAIFADPSVPRSINPAGLDQIFTYWAPVAPVSVFGGIEELPPGCCRIYDENGRRTDYRYWEPEFPEANSSAAEGGPRPSLAEATEGLHERLLQATRLRMLRADVPVGSYLSGGLDSSLIAWMGRTAAHGEFRTFSIRFEDAEFDESAYQRMMATRLESRHEEVMVTRKEIADIFPSVIGHTERPVLRTGPAPMYLLSRLVHNAGFKAVLTGEGADEFLAGYDIFREDAIRRFIARNPSSASRKALFDRLYPYMARSPRQTGGIAAGYWLQGIEQTGARNYSHALRWRTTAALKKFFSDEFRKSLPADIPSDLPFDPPGGFDSWDPLARAQHIEIMTLFSGYILSSQADRMLMAHSVEGRFPFLDAEVIRYCNSLPADFKLVGLNEKQILKRVARGIVPDEIIRRPKQPYRAPDAICFAAADAPAWVAEMLSDDAVRTAGLFNPEMAGNLYEKARRIASGLLPVKHFSLSDNMAIVGILSSQLLYNGFIREGVTRSRPVSWTTAVDR